MPDSDVAGSPPATITSLTAKPLVLGLFAQIGTIAHLYSLMVPALGSYHAGLEMGLITTMAVVGRTCIGSLMPIDTDRRL
jgi:hypothetical protein